MRCPTPKQLNGLDVILSLAEADVAVDAERWPSRHAVHSGFAFLRKYIEVERKVHHGDGARNARRRKLQRAQSRALKKGEQ